MLEGPVFLSIPFYCLVPCQQLGCLVSFGGMRGMAIGASSMPAIVYC